MYLDVWIKRHEGKRNHAYKDTRGIWTVGYGCTGPDIGPDTFWPDEKCEARFAQARDLAITEAQNVVGPIFTSLLNQGSARAAVICDLSFQIGGAGLAEFKNMIEDIRSEAWVDAAHAMLSGVGALPSRLLLQTPRRALENAATLIENKFLGLG